jgi:hypothetical protein
MSEDVRKRAEYIAHRKAADAASKAAKEAADDAYEDIICQYNADEIYVDTAVIAVFEKLHDEIYAKTYSAAYDAAYAGYYMHALKNETNIYHL